MSACFEIELALPLAHFELELGIASSARTLGLFGASGAGKSSVLEALAGWRRPARGRLAIDGQPLFDSARALNLPPERRGLGYVPQELLLLDQRSARANIALGPRAERARLGRVCELLELGELLERPCATLSGGERQRVALARALCSGPRALLLDEPLGALDHALRQRVLPYLVRVRDEFRLPLLYVSHDALELQALCEEVVVLERGRVCAQGAPAEVLRPRTAGLPGVDNVFAAELEAHSGSLVRARLAPGADLFLSGSAAAPGERVLVALAADDVLVARARPQGLSARNALPARVRALREERSVVWLEAALGEDGSGPLLSSQLTAEAVRELELAPGVAVHLVFKTSACRVLARGLHALPPPLDARSAARAAGRT